MVFSRRTFGDEFCQKVFYLVCTFIWLANKVEISLREYQNALIEDVFGYWDAKGFIQTLKSPTEVMTFNGKNRGFISEAHMTFLVQQVGIFGPLAALFGRDIEQEIIKSTCWYSVKESLFQESIDNSKTAIGEASFMKHDDPHLGSRRRY